MSLRPWLVAMAGVLLTAPAAAQTLSITDNRSKHTISVTANNADTQTLLRALAGRTGDKRLDLRPGLLPKISVRLSDVTPEQAMQVVLSQLWASSQVANGRLVVEPRPLMRGAVPVWNGPPPIVSCNLNDWYLGDIVSYLAQAYGQPIRLSSLVRFRTSLSLNNATFDDAIGGILRLGAPGVPLVVRPVGGWLVIGPDGVMWPEEVPDSFLRRVTITARGQNLRAILSTLTVRSGVRIWCDEEVPSDLTMNVIARSEPVWDVVQRIAQAAHLRVMVKGTRSLALVPEPEASVVGGGVEAEVVKP